MSLFQLYENHKLRPKGKWQYTPNFPTYEPKTRGVPMQIETMKQKYDRYTLIVHNWKNINDRQGVKVTFTAPVGVPEDAYYMPYVE